MSVKERYTNFQEISFSTHRKCQFCVSLATHITHIAHTC